MTVREVLEQAAEFEARQRRRCESLGIDVPEQISHLAVRTRTWAAYVDARNEFEKACVANVENVWNGRPISKILLRERLRLEAGRSVDAIELIPPPHQRVYRMGLEHVGYVVSDDFERFRRVHLPVLTGQQFQSVDCTPVYVLFEDYTHVKFYARSLVTTAGRRARTSLRSRMLSGPPRMLRLVPMRSHDGSREHTVQPAGPRIAFDVTDRAVLVTGAGKGLGVHLVDTFLTAGARVVAHHRSSSPTLESRAEHEPRLRLIAGDLADQQFAAEMIEAGFDDDTFTIVVNNAGTYRVTPILDSHPQDFVQALEDNTVTASTACTTPQDACAQPGAGPSSTSRRSAPVGPQVVKRATTARRRPLSG